MSGIRIPTVLYDIQIPLSYVLFKFRYYWCIQICFHMKPIQTYLRGAFINDVTQVGGRGDQYICNTRYKVSSSINISQCGIYYLPDELRNR